MAERVDFLSKEQAYDTDVLLRAESVYREVRSTAHPEIAAQFWNQIRYHFLTETGMTEKEFEYLSWAAFAFRNELDLLTGVDCE